MKIQEIITLNPCCIGPDASLVEAAAEMRALNIGWLPVCDDERLIGTVTDRDIAIRSVAQGFDPNITSVREVMSREVVHCFYDQDIEEAGQIMERSQIRRLPVLDHHQRLVGIISLGDLAVRTGGENLAGRILKHVSERAHQTA